MNIEQIIELLYNQAIDGEFTRNQAVIRHLDKLDGVEKEILMACYWIGFNQGCEDTEE